MNRRGFLRFLGIGAAVATVNPKILLPEIAAPVAPIVAINEGAFVAAATYQMHAATRAIQIQLFKELYVGKMEDLVYKDNPLLKPV